MVRSSPKPSERLAPGWLARIGQDIDIALAPVGGKEESHDENEVSDQSAWRRLLYEGNGSSRENEGTASVVVAPGFDVGVGKEEDGQDDGNNVPLREDQTIGCQCLPFRSRPVTHT
jgi:hypothetical protein